MSDHDEDILIIEDDPRGLRLLGTILMRQGYRIHAATDAAQGLALAERIQPDLILLDWLLPDLRGDEICRRLKAMDKFADTPVVILTGVVDEAQMLNAFEAGAVDYVTKPFTPAVLVARVRTHLRLHRQTRQLAQLADHDGLTGLPNRRAFDTRLQHEWQRSARTKTGLGLILIDVDNFKDYNDCYGHLSGDDALQRVATAIDHALQRAGDFAARYGGEEFIVLSTPCGNEPLTRLAERVRHRVMDLAIPHARSAETGFLLSASLGCACTAPGRHGDPQTLIEAADRQLYEAKRQGKNRVASASDPSRD